MPGIAQVVPIGVSDSDECLDGVDVFLLHLCDAGAGSQQGKSGQCLDISISFKLQRGSLLSRTLARTHQRLDETFLLGYKIYG